MTELEKKAKDYAVKEVNNSFPTAPIQTKKLLEMLLRQAYIEGASNNQDVTIEKINVLSELLNF